MYVCGVFFCVVGVFVCMVMCVVCDVGVFVSWVCVCLVCGVCFCFAWGVCVCGRWVRVVVCLCILFCGEYGVFCVVCGFVCECVGVCV